MDLKNFTLNLTSNHFWIFESRMFTEETLNKTHIQFFLLDPLESGESNPVFTKYKLVALCDIRCEGFSVGGLFTGKILCANQMVVFNILSFLIC